MSSGLPCLQLLRSSSNRVGHLFLHMLAPAAPCSLLELVVEAEHFNPNPLKSLSHCRYCTWVPGIAPISSWDSGESILITLQTLLKITMG